MAHKTRPYFDFTSEQVVALLSEHPFDDEAVTEASQRQSSKVRRALMQALTIRQQSNVAQLVMASVPTVMAPLELALVRAEGKSLVKDDPSIKAQGGRKSTAASRACTAVADLTGHKRGSTEWWDAYKAHSAAQREAGHVIDPKVVVDSPEELLIREPELVLAGVGTQVESSLTTQQALAGYRLAPSRLR